MKKRLGLRYSIWISVLSTPAADAMRYGSNLAL